MTTSDAQPSHRRPAPRRRLGDLVTARQAFMIFVGVGPATVVATGILWTPALVLLIPVLVVVAIGLYDAFQKSHAILRLYPVLGHGRFLAERIRPEIQQYFVESNTNGAPFTRETREIVYTRAKGQQDKLPFGTQLDVYAPGHEYLAHSLYPKTPGRETARLTIGGPDCTQPYNASLLNISAMSYGALSGAAITALSTGAAREGFAQNTGEGGVSPAHLEGGADLIWQIGTGYFGCRRPDGRFDPEMFATQSREPSIKAIEIKLSQGAKPGHGGILPSAKLTPEIAAIRKVELGHDVVSPSSHTAFRTAGELLVFVRLLRELSSGKPIGFKFCVGRQSEVEELVGAMLSTGILPDFITIDGAEGGTGAAPPELSDSVGMPLREGLDLVHGALQASGLRQQVRVIAAGKIATGFDMVRCLALGADLCYSARAMMMALGCIQARRCHTNECPVGIATQDPRRSRAIVVESKADRVAHFHRETITNFLELVGAAGCDHPSQLELRHLSRRIDQSEVVSYDQIYGKAALVPLPAAFSGATTPAPVPFPHSLERTAP